MELETSTAKNTDEKAPGHREVEGVCPIDLHPLATVAADGPAEVEAAVRRARASQPGWAALPLARRVTLLRAACKEMLERRLEVMGLLRLELGKATAEALMSEALGPLDYFEGWVKIARRHLAPRRLPISRLAFPGKRGRVETVPRGVVGIIAPWNYPLANFFKPVFPALLSGNAILMKPSEHAPRTGAWMAAVLSRHLPPGIVQVLQGDGEVGQALVRAGIDAVTFTGSVSSGKAVMRAAAEAMIPCSVELGGKDAALVLADCDLDRTVAGILYWGLHNVGQNCGAIERVYVQAEIADDFVSKLADAARRLRASLSSPALEYDVGPLANAAQLAVVEAHVADAVTRGARVRAGGKRGEAGLWYLPTVLDECDHTMRVMREETFGPVIAVTRVRDVDEAVRLANDSRYGLNASIWTGDETRAELIARRLEAGSVFVNNHAITGAMACAPWTGVKDTGYGIAGSELALAHYTRPRTLLIDSNRGPDIWWFPLDRTLVELGHRLAEAQLGRFWEALPVPLLLRRRARHILDFINPRR